MANRLEADGLPVKRVRVNAQVTFMISILEIIGGLIAKMVVHIFKSTTIPVVINVGIMYLILLPRVFLMNTSYNKSRIIEHGWRNILKNTFGLSATPSYSGCDRRRGSSETKNSRTLSQPQATIHPYKKDPVYPKISSPNTRNIVPTGSTSMFREDATKNISDVKQEPEMMRLEVIMRPGTLEKTHQIDRSIVNFLTKETGRIKGGKNGLDSVGAKLTKKTCSKRNEKLLIIDLEQESELLFGFK